MLEIDYKGPYSGWDKPRIVPYHKLEVYTAATSLHYGISGFEGFTVLQNHTTKAP